MLKTLPDQSVHCCITSPPYWGLRSYLPAGHPDKPREIGSEPTVGEWVSVMVDVFREVRRVLRDDGVLFLNLGDSYFGGGRGGGTKNNGSFDEAMAVMPATRNPRSVRWLASEPFRGAHFATYPAELIRPFVLAGCPPGGVILDPFLGSGTTALVADQEGRDCIGIDLDDRNRPMAEDRLRVDSSLFVEIV